LYPPEKNSVDVSIFQRALENHSISAESNLDLQQVSVFSPHPPPFVNKRSYE